LAVYAVRKPLVDPAGLKNVGTWHEGLARRPGALKRVKLKHCMDARPRAGGRIAARRAVFWLSAAVFAILIPLFARAGQLPVAWVEIGADGALSTRAVVAADADCPPVTANLRGMMRSRAEPDARLPIRICEAQLPAATTNLVVGAVPMPTLPATVHRIAVIGDTGCRLEGAAVQDCNDAAAWPFAEIARRAAARKPDLVIHVGDYYYRETACPVGRAGCAGSPYGDDWGAWQADFFDPAAPLLAAAPWIMVRGNHELCSRGGHGWTALLDPHPGVSDCVDKTEPYRLDVGGVELLVFDSANADDFKATPDKVAAYAAQLANLLSMPQGHAWLLTHRPVWAMAQGNLVGLTPNATLQEAIRGKVPPGLDLVLSGHLHDFISYSFASERPAQLIVGVGGDALLELGKSPLAGAEIDGMRVASGFALKHFGYFIMDAAAEGWDGSLYGSDDAVLAHCQLRGRSLECAPVPAP
jgi:predicted phosphodiesterase